MKFNLAIPVLAVRKEPNHRSELINQILFGESIELIEHFEGWSFLKTVHDEYVGWVENKIFYFEKPQATSLTKIISSFSASLKYQKIVMTIPFGSYFAGGENDLLSGNYIIKCNVQSALELIQSQFLAAPYLWGGRTGFGIDCSGLTQLFYRLTGVSIPRDAHMQASLGDDIFLSQVKAGDLLFYQNDGNKIVHVGIAIDNKYVIHASGNVRIDSYDARGIFNNILEIYSHKFAFAKRIIRHE